MHNQKLKDNSGFTLIEILVVIVILAILSTLAIVQYYGINAKARDSARRADVYEIATALEVNKVPEGYVPLQVNQFSFFQWVDPAGNVYCIASGNPANPSETAAWGNSCPVGFSVVAVGVPSGGGVLNWKLCTFLEKPDSGGSNVFCRSSRQ